MKWWNFNRICTISLNFEIYFLGFPWDIVFGAISGNHPYLQLGNVKRTAKKPKIILLPAFSPLKTEIAWFPIGFLLTSLPFPYHPFGIFPLFSPYSLSPFVRGDLLAAKLQEKDLVSQVKFFSSVDGNATSRVCVFRVTFLPLMVNNWQARSIYSNSLNTWKTRQKFLLCVCVCMCWGGGTAIWSSSYGANCDPQNFITFNYVNSHCCLFQCPLTYSACVGGWGGVEASLIL